MILYKRLLAALMFFTRLPLWRIVNLPPKSFERIVPFWAFTGWFTAGMQVAIFLLASLLFPKEIALIFAILTRLLVTGCLHEDGLADFFDGMGGGTNRERILSIMKDSHIGTYGVIGLIFYFLLYYTTLVTLPPELISIAILVGDPLNKSIASMIINWLPYARKAEESKSKTVYSKMNYQEYLISLFTGALALCWLPSDKYLIAIIPSLLIWWLLTSFMKHKIQGYTGDCCGALFLLCELCFYLSFITIWKFI